MKVSKYIKNKIGFKFKRLCFSTPNDMKKFIAKLENIYEQCKLPDIIEVKNFKKDILFNYQYYSVPKYIDISLLNAKGGKIKTYIDSEVNRIIYYLEKNGKVIDYIEDPNQIKVLNLPELILYNDNGKWRQVTGLKRDVINGILQIFYTKWEKNAYTLYGINIDINTINGDILKVIKRVENPNNKLIRRYLFKKKDGKISI